MKSVMKPLLRSKNKKAESTMFLAMAILGVIVILLLSVWLYTFYKAAKDSAEAKNCRNSIAAHEFLVSSSKGEVFTDIKCPTRQFILNTNNEEKLKSDIAEDMHRCWYEWGQGNGKYFEGDGIFCHVCAIYDFNNKDVQVQGFAQYLAKQPIKIKYPGDKPGLSYQDYLDGYQSPKSAELLAKMPSGATNYDYINTSQKYATIFVYISGKDALQKFFEGRGTAFAVGGTGAIILGGLATYLGASAMVGAGVTAGVTAFVGGATAGAAATAASTAAMGATVAWIPVAGWIIGGACFLVAGASVVYLVYEAKTTEPFWISLITFTPYNADNIKQLGCQKIETNQLSNTAANPATNP